jgi:hypothetical protein
VRFMRVLGLHTMFLLVAVCLAPDCGDEHSPACPQQPLGLIQGFVLGGGKPVDYTVVASPVDYHDQSEYSTHTDSTGWYALALPAGAYLLGRGSISGYYSSDGYVWDRKDADTLVVGEGPIRADLIGGALTVILGVSADTTGSSYWCVAFGLKGDSHGSWDHPSRASDRATSVQGAVTFEMPLLAAGTYVLECEPSGESPIWLPPTVDMADADRVIIEAGRSYVYSAQLPAPAVLILETRGSWQTLNLDPPRVDAYSTDSTQLDGIGISNVGTGQLSIRAPVSLKLHIEIGNVGRWYDGWTFSEAQTLTLTPGDPPLHIAYRESAILCTLVRPGLLVNRVQYDLYDETGHRLTEDWFQPFRPRPAPLPNLLPGTYYLRVQPDNLLGPQPWLLQWFDQQDSLASATPIVVSAEGIVVPVTMTLVEGGSISGRVREGDGSPYDGPLHVRLRGDSDEDLREVQTDGLTGDYTVIGLPDGDYLVAIQFGWYRLCWYPGTLIMQEAEPVRIRDHARLVDVDWQIPPVVMASQR